MTRLFRGVALANGSARIKLEHDIGYGVSLAARQLSFRIIERQHWNLYDGGELRLRKGRPMPIKCRG